jgi:hypothetical protein
VQISAKLAQSVTIPLHSVGDALTLLQQLRQRRVVSRRDVAIAGNARL